MLDGKVVFPIIGERFVERGVFFGGDIGWIASPDGFGLVEFLFFDLGLFDLFGLLLLLLFFLIINFFNLGLLLIALLSLLSLFIWDFLLSLLENMEIDGV